VGAVKKPQSTGGSLLELVVIVAVALGLALGIQAFLVKPYRIPSESMVPTLQIGQRVLVNRIGHSFSKPSVGDVVVFHPPLGADGDPRCGVQHPRTEVCSRPVNQRDDVNFIKRVVAGPGDKIAIEQGHVILNGKRQKEPFARPCGVGEGCDYPDEITVPAGHYFMMGDNRGSSEVIRFW
jgi:signal peptidase I